MKRFLLISILILSTLFIHNGFANKLILQEGDSLIKVTGIITDEDDNQPIAAKVFYEKLPYYDDMGFAMANKKSGVYEMYMILGTKYSVEVSAVDFDPIKFEMTVVDEGNGEMKHDFSLSPDFANKKLTIKDLNFASGRSVISKSSYAGLDEFVGWLKARPNAIVQLEGHTDLDSRANAAANLQLSKDRVEAVKSYLVKKGIKKNRVKTKAFGGTQPITRDRTPEGRAINRRVEVQVIHQ